MNLVERTGEHGPDTSERTGAWEALHHLMRILDSDGIPAAGEFLRAAQGRVDDATVATHPLTGSPRAGAPSPDQTGQRKTSSGSHSTISGTSTITSRPTSSASTNGVTWRVRPMNETRLTLLTT